MKRAFAVGRCNGKTRAVWVLRLRSPIAGPFTVCAVVGRA